MILKNGVVALALLLTPACAACATEGEPADEAARVVLSSENTKMWHAWPLKFGQALQRSLRLLDEDEPEEALEAAKMYFILCPADEKSINRAVEHVKRVLEAVDGHPARANEFEQYALYGPAGPDGAAGTEDDVEDPLAQVSPEPIVPDGDHLKEYDAVIDRRAAVTDGWDRDWYETQKAFERLNCAAFTDAAGLLVEVLAEQVQRPHAPEEENWELKRVQQIIDRAQAGLGVVYRAREGTAAGLEEFRKTCLDYVVYGPPGKDQEIGTEDDLAPPI